MKKTFGKVAEYSKLKKGNYSSYLSVFPWKAKICRSNACPCFPGEQKNVGLMLVGVSLESKKLSV